MKFELFIARKLKLGADENNITSSTPILNIAVLGIVLAIVIMILSITIVCGFKNEIANKIYDLDSHIKISNSSFSQSTNNTKVNKDVLCKELCDSMSFIKSLELIAEKPAIIKTDKDFKGIVFRGVDKNYDWNYINKSIIEGRVPNNSDDAPISEIVLSQSIAKQLNLKIGDKILTYFIDEKVKVRNSKIVGIFNTDFEDFDNAFILGNIKIVQQINGWLPNEGSYIGIKCKDFKNIEDNAYTISSTLIKLNYKEQNNAIIYDVTNTKETNISYFAWLDLLDMNVVIILILMIAVSNFTLIAGLLIIVLKRINMIGVLKALGACNSSIRNIFILLTQKLILRAIIIGNTIGLSLAMAQKFFHLIKLNPEAYYMSFVPIDINWLYIVILNIGIIIIAYITLLLPSYIISTIKPSASIRFE
ncbi:MAG: ABC transporter permease [Muribaculaceae bacterium]